MSIKAIDHSSVHRLTSGQVVIDLQTAVKELLENALDAGASSVEIRFKEHGLESFEVLDNGRGIAPSDYAGLALKHHTSKLTSFADLTSVTTLGFRGEALSSLCGVSSVFSIVTATAESAPVGQSLTFDSAGNCTLGPKSARQKGTTVKVEGLFKQLPVRRKELERNVKREFGKVVELAQAYALVCTGRRIELKNSVKGKQTTHLQTSIQQTVRANFSAIFSPKTAQTMMDLDLTLDVAADKSLIRHSAADPSRPTSTTVFVKGLVSKPTTGSGRSTSSRQFFYINGRPFAPLKLSKAFNEVYKSFNSNSFPCVVADFILPTDAYDVNVSPDKRTVFLHSEANLVFALKNALELLFEPSRGTFDARPIQQKLTQRDSDKRDRDERVQAAGQRQQLFNIDSDSDDDGDAEAEDTAMAAVKEEFEDDALRPAKRLRLSPERETEEPPAREVDEPDEPMAKGSQPLESSQPVSTQDQPDELLESPPPPSHIPLQRPPPVPSTSRTQLDDDPAPGPPSAVEEDEIDLTASQLRADIQAQPYSQQPTLLQMTLDTGGAAWSIKQPAALGASRLKPLARRTSSGSGSSGGSLAPPAGAGGARMERKKSHELKNAQKLIRSFVHPSEVRRYIDDEAGVSGAHEDDSDEDEQLDTGGETLDESSDEDEPVVLGEQTVTDLVEGTCCEHHSDPEQPLAELEQVDPTTQPPAPAPFPSAYRDEVSRPTVVAVDTTVNFSLDKLSRVWARPTRAGAALAARLRKRALLADSTDEPEPSAAGNGAQGASIENSAADAEIVLSRTVSKDDFAQMEVIGQFNLGFIIARRRHDQHGAGEDDLFIVDQHASDEKYNFERLQAETVIQSQQLLVPRALSLPAHDELTAIEHRAQIEMNGFELEIDESLPAGERVKLVAQPTSKETVFGVDDLEELLDLCAAAGAGEVVRPSKARRMFASRACRKSIMIGTALSRRQMSSILKHMGTMEQPWSCPHGRPTMRYLMNMTAAGGTGGETSFGDERQDLFALLQSIGK